MPAVSAAMIVRNEALRIADAIRSVQRVRSVAEVCVLDTGSTDDTVEIARSLGARVVEEAWPGRFDVARNRNLALCRHDLVLTLDGDEVLQDAGSLDAFCERPWADAAALQVSCIGPSGRVGERLQSVRVYRRSQATWRFAVHNQLVGYESVTVLPAQILAYYDEDVFAQARQRLPALLAAAEAEPDEPHYAQYLTKSYRVLNELPKVVEWGERYLGMAPNRADAASTVVFVIEALLCLGREAEAIRWVGWARAHHPGFSDVERMALLVAAARWGAAVHDPPTRYLMTPRRFDQAAGELRTVSRLLELPLELPELGSPLDVAVGEPTDHEAPRFIRRTARPKSGGVGVAIPVWRRQELLPPVVACLRAQTRPPDHIVLVGSGDPSLHLLGDALGCEVLDVPNTCLGDKFNAAMAALRGCEFAMLLGSDNLLGPRWIERSLAGLDDGLMIGAEDLFVLRIPGLRLVHWAGYAPGTRTDPVGAGRVYSGEILDRVDWQLVPVGQAPRVGLDLANAEHLMAAWPSRAVRRLRCGPDSAVVDIKAGLSQTSAASLPGRPIADVRRWLERHVPAAAEAILAIEWGHG